MNGKKHSTKPPHDKKLLFARFRKHFVSLEITGKVVNNKVWVEVSFINFP